MAAEVEHKLRATPDQFLLKPNTSAKAPIWKQFSLIYHLRNNSDDSEAESDEIKYYCACNKCRKVYCYKAPDGSSSYGTNNLINHSKQCIAISQVQPLTYTI